MSLDMQFYSENAINFTVYLFAKRYKCNRSISWQQVKIGLIKGTHRIVCSLNGHMILALKYMIFLFVRSYAIWYIILLLNVFFIMPRSFAVCTQRSHFCMAPKAIIPKEYSLRFFFFFFSLLVFFSFHSALASIQ